MGNKSKVASFLGSGIPTPKKQENVIPFPQKSMAYGLAQQYLHDCNSASDGELRVKYKLTYSSWKNMKSRAKLGAIIAQEFECFRSFLSLVGPRLSAKYTLDRLNNADNEYAPGKVEWRDKYAQNSNKGNNVYLTDNKGISKTISQWAAEKKIDPSTIRKRLKAGLSHHHAIHGVTGSAKLGKILNAPWPIDREAEWEEKWRMTLSSPPYVSREEFFYRLAASHLANCQMEHDKLEKQAFDLDMEVGYGGSAEAEELLKELLARHSVVSARLARARVVAENSEHHRRYRLRVEELRRSENREQQRAASLVPRPPRIPALKSKALSIDCTNNGPAQKVVAGQAAPPVSPKVG